MIRVAIRSALEPEYRWVLKLFARDHRLQLEFAAADADIVISEEGDADLPLSPAFVQAVRTGVYRHEQLFDENCRDESGAPLIRLPNGRPDRLSTCFYLLACLQEQGHSAADTYGRFPYAASLQARFGVPDRDLVGEQFAALRAETPGFARHPPPEPEPSRLFVSHDIDQVHRAWREDGKYLLKRGQLRPWLNMVGRQLRHRPDWLNTAELLDMDRKAGFEPTFFWLPVSGRSVAGPPNADYRIDAAHIRAEIEALRASGAEIALHKSISALTHREEIERLALQVRVNRNHFLYIRLPDHWHAFDASGLPLDASLGFSEQPGFRNGYARPYNPFDLSRRRPFEFLELPLNLMDTTFRFYRKLDPEAALKEAEAFLERHRQGAVISLLWHNNYISRYAYGGWRSIYPRLLARAAELGYRSATPEALLHDFA